MKNKPDKTTKEKWENDDSNWKLGIFYYNPADKRIFPPKRTDWVGWTINFANPVSIIVNVATIGLLMTGLIFLVNRF